MSRGGPRPGAGRPKNPAKKPTKKRGLFVRLYPETHEQFTALSEEQKALSQADIIAALVKKAHINQERLRLERETNQNIEDFLRSLPITEDMVNLFEPVVATLVDLDIDIEIRLKTLNEAPLSTYEKFGLYLCAQRILHLKRVGFSELERVLLELHQDSLTTRLDPSHVPTANPHQLDFNKQDRIRELQNHQTNQLISMVKLQRENEKQLKKVNEHNACAAQLTNALNGWKPETLH